MDYLNIYDNVKLKIYEEMNLSTRCDNKTYVCTFLIFTYLNAPL